MRTRLSATPSLQTCRFHLASLQTLRWRTIMTAVVADPHDFNHTVLNMDPREIWRIASTCCRYFGATFECPIGSLLVLTSIREERLINSKEVDLVSPHQLHNSWRPQTWSGDVPHSCRGSTCLPQSNPHTPSYFSLWHDRCITHAAMMIICPS